MIIKGSATAQHFISSVSMGRIQDPIASLKAIVNLSIEVQDDTTLCMIIAVHFSVQHWSLHPHISSSNNMQDLPPPGKHYIYLRTHTTAHRSCWMFLSVTDEHFVYLNLKTEHANLTVQFVNELLQLVDLGAPVVVWLNGNP